jgi:hypothetical protein
LRLKGRPAPVGPTSTAVTVQQLRIGCGWVEKPGVDGAEAYWMCIKINSMGRCSILSKSAHLKFYEEVSVIIHMLAYI